MPKDKEVVKSSILAAQLQFGIELLRMSPVKKTEVVSPANLSLALTLLHQGTDAKYRKKIAKVLLKGTCEDHFLQNEKYLHETLQKSKQGVELAIANGLFLSNRLKIKQDYVKGLKENFQVVPTTMDFNNTKECMQAITEFMKKATRGKMAPSMDESDIKNTLATIISVLYAKAAWEMPFDCLFTKQETFTKIDGTTVQIPFMNSYWECGDYPYYKDDEVAILSKPYKDANYQFVWILPNDTSAKGFTKFRDGLTGSKIQKYLTNLRRETVMVKVPKMSLNCKYKMEAILEHLGLSELCGDVYSKITDGGLLLKSGEHSTLLEVDEFGTVAVSSIEFTLLAGVGGPAYKNFYANRSFLFLMHKNQQPIMMGQFLGPK